MMGMYYLHYVNLSVSEHVHVHMHLYTVKNDLLW